MKDNQFHQLVRLYTHPDSVYKHNHPQVLLQLAGEPVAATTKNIESLANQVDLKIENLAEEPETEVKLVVSDLGDEW